MAKTIGIMLGEGIEAGVVVDNKLTGEISHFPEDPSETDALVEKPHEDLVELLCDRVIDIAAGATDVTAVGVGLPGLVRNGVVEEAPNLPQLKGAKVQQTLCAALHKRGFETNVKLVNDADAMAAGLAAQHGKLDHMIRVWTLGLGIGYGRYPFLEGVWEGGHTVVTLDDKERYCGCGGRGHLEGIMGHRAMRMRFLDLEPEEVFEAAAKGDERCVEFKKLWHKALAAATASSIHVSGAGKFYLTGMNTRFLDLPMLDNYLHQMVTMSPLQGFSMEIVKHSSTAAVLGAGIIAGMETTPRQ
ncbi:ROK family protein [Terriglobus tenax]|uniref:ROK family protein n=1 Tax=Terriglobus tenax TaxID=1111115 RepID=UPI0021E0A6D7|nr:ROK family protein [Terriglobus tenax]